MSSGLRFHRGTARGDMARLKTLPARRPPWHHLTGHRSTHPASDAKVEADPVPSPASCHYEKASIICFFFTNRKGTLAQRFQAYSSHKSSLYLLQSVAEFRRRLCKRRTGHGSLQLFCPGRAGMEHWEVAVELKVAQNFLDKRAVGGVPKDELGDINLCIQQ